MSTNRIRVVLADHHQIVRVGLQEMLEGAGDFEVVGHAGDGEDAVRVALELTPDVVVMDVLLPVKDGIETCREIKGALPDTQVLILTASTGESDALDAVLAGASGYLPKDSDKERLLATVRDVVPGRIPDPRRRRKESAERQAVIREVGILVFRSATDSQAAGDTHAFRAGAFLRPDCRGPGQEAADNSQLHLRHSEKTAGQVQAGNGRLGGPQRLAGRRPGPWIDQRFRAEQETGHTLSQRQPSDKFDRVSCVHRSRWGWLKPGSVRTGAFRFAIHVPPLPLLLFAFAAANQFPIRFLCVPFFAP